MDPFGSRGLFVVRLESEVLLFACFKCQFFRSWFFFPSRLLSVFRKRPKWIKPQASSIISGWWFGTWLLFFYMTWECHHPNWRSIFFRVVGQPPSSTALVAWDTSAFKFCKEILAFKKIPWRFHVTFQRNKSFHGDGWKWEEISKLFKMSLGSSHHFVCMFVSVAPPSCVDSWVSLVQVANQFYRRGSDQQPVDWWHPCHDIM